MYQRLESGLPIQLESLLRSSANRDEQLQCMTLLLVRGGNAHPLPDLAMELFPGDNLLVAGTREARTLQALAIANVNVFQYLKTGRETTGGWLWQTLRPRA